MAVGGGWWVAVGGHSRWAQGGFRGPAHVRVCSASSTAVSLFGTSPYPVIAATGVQAVLHAEYLELHIAIASTMCRPAGMAFLAGRKERRKGRGGVQRSRPVGAWRAGVVWVAHRGSPLPSIAGCLAEAAHLSDVLLHLGPHRCHERSSRTSPASFQGPGIGKAAM